MHHPIKSVKEESDLPSLHPPPPPHLNLHSLLFYAPFLSLPSSQTEPKPRQTLSPNQPASLLQIYICQVPVLPLLPFLLTPLSSPCASPQSELSDARTPPASSFPLC